MEHKEQKSNINYLIWHTFGCKMSVLEVVQALRQTLPLKYCLGTVILVPALPCSFPEICLKPGCLCSENCY